MCSFAIFIVLNTISPSSILPPPYSPPTHTLVPYTTLFRAPPSLAPARFLHALPVLSACDRPVSRARPPAPTRCNCPASPPMPDHHHPIPVADRARAMQH